MLGHILSEPSPLGTNEHTDIDDYTFFINHALGSRCWFTGLRFQSSRRLARNSVRTLRESMRAGSLSRAYSLEKGCGTMPWGRPGIFRSIFLILSGSCLRKMRLMSGQNSRSMLDVASEPTAPANRLMVSPKPRSLRG